MSSNLDGDKTQYFRDLLSWECEGERSPAQSEPHEIAMDPSTPSLLRRQAA